MAGRAQWSYSLWRVCNHHLASRYMPGRDVVVACARFYLSLLIGGVSLSLLTTTGVALTGGVLLPGSMRD